MTAAANFTEAAQFALGNAWGIFLGANTLRGQLDLWRRAIANELDPTNLRQRTVLNWVPATGPEFDALPAAKVDEDGSHVDCTGIVLHRMCRAIESAENDGRISAAQAANLLTSYNNIWA